jgi:hypothetical protein
MAQWSLFDAPDVGDLDVFVRYDLVSLGQDSIADRAEQRAVRTGLNYNPDWDSMGIPEARNLPAVRWKQQNLDKPAPDRRKALIDRLEYVLSP